MIIRFIGRWQARDFRKGATILKLAANVMKVTGQAAELGLGMTKTGTIDEVRKGERGLEGFFIVFRFGLAFPDTVRSAEWCHGFFQQ